MYSIYKNGTELLSFQSFLEMETKQEAKTAVQPIENGSFTVVNKVVSPITRTVQLALQGTVNTINSAVKILEDELKAASVIQIVTPRGVTEELTIIGLSYADTIENGYGRLLVSLNLQEIRQVQSQYSSVDPNAITAAQAKNASDASTENDGEVNASVLAQIVG